MPKARDKHFDEFEPHTLLKHAILRTYLATWAMRLLQWGRGGDAVYFVDAFAGLGRDKVGNPGSPLIAARIAAETQAHLRANGFPAATMRVICVEKEPRIARGLREYMAPFDASDPGLVTIYEGELVDHIDTILATIRRAPTLYFLDPYGVQGLDASTYPKALAAPSTEMFVLFSDLGANRLRGVVTASAVDVEAQIERLRADRPMLPLPEFEAIAEAEANAMRGAERVRVEALDLTRPASYDYLVRALGGDEWVRELQGIPTADLPDEFLARFLRRLIAAGAGHLLTVPMRNAEGRYVYSLVHASKSLKGFTVMKESVSTGLRSGTLPEEVCIQIRRDLEVSIAPIVDLLARTYSGRTVRWTLPKGEDGDCARRFILQNTPTFDFQLEDVRDALVRRGYIPVGRTGKPQTPILVTFPPAEADALRPPASAE